MSPLQPLTSRFDLTDRVCIITGGSGLLGRQHACALAAAGGVPVLVDLPRARPMDRATALAEEIGSPVFGREVDVTDRSQIADLAEWTMQTFRRVDVLINNAANNPKVDAGGLSHWSRLESFPLDIWNEDIAVGLTGAFLCAQALGPLMVLQGKGVILNVASDLALIGPDQRIYRTEGLRDDQQPAKPVSYSVVKAGLLGLTRWLATWWADKGIRVNSITPAGVFDGQPPEFVNRLSQLIPMGRMAEPDEYRAAVLFLCSDASSYMTGANLVIDGGRTAW